MLKTGSLSLCAGQRKDELFWNPLVLWVGFLVTQWICQSQGKGKTLCISTRTSTGCWECLVVFWKRNPKRLANEGGGGLTPFLGQILSLLLPLQMLFRVCTTISWKKFIKKKSTAKHGHMSFCNFLTLQSHAHENIHGWPHTEAAVVSGLQFIFQLPPWCQLQLWKQWLIEAIAETSLKEYFRTAQSSTCHYRGTGN